MSLIAMWRHIRLDEVTLILGNVGKLPIKPTCFTTCWKLGTRSIKAYWKTGWLCMKCTFSFDQKVGWFLYFGTWYVLWSTFLAPASGCLPQSIWRVCSLAPPKGLMHMEILLANFEGLPFSAACSASHPTWLVHPSSKSHPPIQAVGRSPTLTWH